MPQIQHRSLKITGTVYDRDDYDPSEPAARLWQVDKATYELNPNEQIADEVEFQGRVLLTIRIPFEAGDIRVDARQDFLGRLASAGGHKNYGYSGFFKAYVFDGKRWRNLKTHAMYSLDTGHYSAQQDKAKAIKRARDAIERLRGRELLWRDKAYTLEGQ